MNMKRSNCICFVFLSLLALVVPARNGFAQDANMLLCDGETSFQSDYGSRNTTQAFRGQGCLEGVPDKWHAPVIRLGGLPSYRSNLSGYDEIWFFAKSDQLGKTFDVTIGAYTGKSNVVNVGAYIEGGVLDTTYRLVRIPISALKTATYTLDIVEAIYFGVANPTPGHKIYIDDIWAVKLSTVDPNTAPFVTGYGLISFGDVPVRTSQTKSVNVTNAGKGPLVVSSLSISGAQSGEFSIPTAPFTLEPGQSQRIDAVFSPTTPADVTGTLNLSHNATVMGSTTSIPISGRGVSSLLVLPSDSLDFGTAPQGRTVSWPFLFNNRGNQDLVISNLTATQQFSVTPATLTVPPDGTGEVRVSFTPAADGRVQGRLTFAANDPNNPQKEIQLDAEGVPAGAGAATLALRITQTTSSKVTVAWPTFSGADAVNVYLAPEPEGTRNEPLYKMLVSQQPGTSTGCVIDKLSAASDAFFRVEALSGTQVLAAGFVHARTVGGPRATLDTAVREVHAFAPNVLMVVLENKQVKSYSGTTGSLVGDTGPEWQAGPWTLTRPDGTPIQVTNVYRHSIPVGQTYYEIGPGTPLHQDLLDVDHRIYLVLGAPVGAREILHVQGPRGADFVVPFSDAYLETPVIQVNQVGYSPRASKRWAYISGWMGDGGPLSLAGFPAAADVLVDPDDPNVVRTAVVSGLAITQRAANDTDAGCEVRQIDLASAPPGEGIVYRVRVPGVGVSWPTQVSETAVFKAFFTIVRGLYFERWGRDLQPQWTEWSPRPPDHPVIFTGELLDSTGKPRFGPKAFFTSSTPKVGERRFAGGHHNAGDFDVQASDQVIAMLLMRAYEINPTAFADGQLNIPESGNGIPDMLDEALWNLAAWEQLQEADGGVRLGVESYRHPNGIDFADNDPLPFWTYSRGTLHTTGVAGIFAQAARLVAPFNAAKSDELRDRAIRAYDYAVANGADASFRGALLYATGELYRLTGQQKYKDTFEATWDACDKWRTGFPGVYAYLPPISAYGDTPSLIADQILGYLGSQGANPTYLSKSTAKLGAMADDAVNAIESGGAHRNGRNPTATPTWGKGTVVGEYMMRVYTRMQLGNLAPDAAQRYFDATSLSADYVLGCNPEGMVWITGLGSRHPENPLHNDSLAFIKEGKGPMPGFPVFGPTKSLPGVERYDYGEYTFYPAFLSQPLMRHYADIWTFVANNEGGPQMMSMHAELFGVLLASSMMPPASWLPGGKEHRNTLAPREGTIPGSPTRDTLRPVIVLNGSPSVNIEVPTPYVDAGATATDNVDGNITSRIVTVNSVDSSKAGDYTVTYNVVDSSGNAAIQVVRNVKVVDAAAPVIVLNGSPSVTLEVLTPYVDAGATATDNADGDITSKIVTVNSVDSSKAGDYTVTYDVVDSSGHAAIQVVRSVKVVDAVAPMIVLNGSPLVTLEVLASYVDAGAMATDNVDGNITSRIVIVNSVVSSKVGDYTVTYDVVDSSGNAAIQVVRNVKVVDTTAPVITIKQP